MELKKYFAFWASFEIIMKVDGVAKQRLVRDFHSLGGGLNLSKSPADLDLAIVLSNIPWLNA